MKNKSWQLKKLINNISSDKIDNVGDGKVFVCKGN